jgi:uncharacterized protein (DUF1778 family)
MQVRSRKTRHAGRRKQTPAVMERLEARIPREQKMLFQHAAELQGVTLTDFVIDALKEAAMKTVEDHTVIRLAAEERETFLHALLNPPRPNQALREGAQRYRRMVAH